MSNRTAESMMTPNPVTCSVDDSLNVAAQRMWDHDVGALPVVDGGGKVAGMITDRDVAMAAYTQGKSLTQISVKNAMSANVWCVQPHSSLSHVEMLMRRHQVRRIPVVDGEHRPIGMVSLNDLARCTRASEGAKISQEELTQTLSAVCEPRSMAMAS
jgi:CBS domain-containing protein